MTQSSYPIDDTMAGARGATACLEQITGTLATTTSERAATPEQLRHIALTLQAQAQRASLGAMSLAAHAGRLEAFAVAQSLEAEAEARRHAAARAEVEQEAEKDAALFLRDDAPGREPLSEWMSTAFAGQWEDFWGPSLGIDRDLAERWYHGAFEVALGRLANIPIGPAGMLTLAQREADAKGRSNGGSDDG